MKVTPHAAQKERGSALAVRTTRHVWHGLIQKKRKMVEKFFGWLKIIELMRKARPEARPPVLCRTFFFPG
jgi:hypothetical protein